jgi:hypothetical protein
MTAVEKGVAAGERAAPKRKNHWKPLGYTYRGRLIAKIEDTTNGEVEKILYDAGDLIHRELGRGTDGDVRRFTAKGGLKKIAKAMLNTRASWYYDVVAEASAARKAADGDRTEAPKRARRKR